jgi:hypothetical protein
MMVQESIEQLIRLVEHEAGLYEGFLDCTLRQRQALICNAEPEIRALTLEQDRLLRQISATEKSSAAVVSRCAQQVELDCENASIAALAERLEERHSQQLMSAAHRLLETGTRVRSENMINRYLIGNLIELTDFCLRSVAGISPTTPAYGSDGSVLQQQQPQSLTLDWRV